MSIPVIPRSWQTVSLGFQGTPYPTVQADGSLVLSGDYVPRIASTLTTEQVNGVAFRDMPAPEHLPYFLNLLDAINKKGRRVFMYVSEPGIGKSFLGHLVSQMMIGEKALSYECGDKRLGDLLFTTDLTERPEQTLYDRVLQKVREGKAHPLSKARLAKALGTAFDATTAHVDWDKLLTSDADIAAVDEAFKSVGQAEGINQQSTIALREDNGLLVQAYEQDRIALADEYTKGKPGSDTALQTTLQWLAREGQAEITVQSNSGRSYELGNLNAKPGFFAIFTGNATSDGIGTFELSQSQYSRLQPSYLPNLGKLGLAHRFCQVMTGLPISTLYRLYGPSFENNAEGFAIFCQGLRTLGLSSLEAEAMPAHHRALLDHPMQVIDAAEKCAEFFVRWQNKTNLNNSSLPANLMAELTEDYVKANTPDPRLFIMLFHRALERAERRAAKVESIKPGFIFAPITDEDLAALSATSRTGSAFMELIAEEIKNKTQSQPNLRSILMSDAAELGLLPSNQQGTVKNLAQLLNVEIAPMASANLDATLDLVKDWGDIFGADIAATSEQLKPFLPAIDRTLSILKTDQGHFVTYQADPAAVDLTQPQGPFTMATIRKVEFERRGSDTYLVGDDENKTFASDRLLTVSQFVAALMIPGGADALTRTWLQVNKSQLELPFIYSVIVADDHDRSREQILLILRQDAAPQSTVIVSNAPLSLALDEKLQGYNRITGDTLTYCDASQGIDARQIIAGLKRSDHNVNWMIEAFGKILEPAALSKISSSNRLLDAATAMTGQRNTGTAKVEKIVAEILKGEAIQLGYVAVTVPSHTSELMKGVKSFQAARPAGQPAQPQSITVPGGMS